LYKKHKRSNCFAIWNVYIVIVTHIHQRCNRVWVCRRMYRSCVSHTKSNQDVLDVASLMDEKYSFITIALDLHATNELGLLSVISKESLSALSILSSAFFNSANSNSSSTYKADPWHRYLLEHVNLLVKIIMKECSFHNKLFYLEISFCCYCQKSSYWFISNYWWKISS